MAHLKLTNQHYYGLFYEPITMYTRFLTTVVLIWVP